MSFQYLSFQRSPPSHLHYGQQLAISPLLTNDLREAKFRPKGQGEVCIEVAWVTVDDGNGTQWKVVKREQDIEWLGEETAWRNVHIAAPSWKEVQGATRGLRQSDRNICRAQTKIRLAMWVSGQYTSMQPTAPGVGNATRVAKKHKIEKSSTYNSAELLARLAIDPCHVAILGLQRGEDVFLPVLTPLITLSSSEDSSDCATGPAQKLSEIARLWHVPDIRPDRPSGRQQQYVEIREELGYQLDKVSRAVRRKDHLQQSHSVAVATSVSAQSSLVHGSHSAPRHSQHVWDASLALMGSMCLAPSEKLRGKEGRHWDKRPGPRPQDLLASSRGCVTVELGTGTGLLSLWLQRLWVEPCMTAEADTENGREREFHAVRKMFLTDLAGSLDLAESNASLSRTAYRALRSESETKSSMPDLAILGLDWFSPLLPQQIVAALRGPSGAQEQQVGEGEDPKTRCPRAHLLVMASDCSYNPDAYPALAGTIKRLLLLADDTTSDASSGNEEVDFASDADLNGPQAMCLLAKKHRNPDERALWDALLFEDLHVHLVQGWHDDHEKHAGIAGVGQGPSGTAEMQDLAEDALGKWGIYVVVLAQKKDHR